MGQYDEFDIRKTSIVIATERTGGHKLLIQSKHVYHLLDSLVVECWL